MTTTTMEFNSVTFTNFPAFVENGEISGYPLMSAVVADRYAERFPVEDRKAITVDFAKLDVTRLMEEAKEQIGVKSPFETEEEADAAEQELIRVLSEEGLFGATR
ncbi:hypothetical protein [Alicyclobacillus macrosporangiidus]|uniref:Uncharacterized protein n=1 Tax=Alicyclobacillus macrosporangiidus TaxID=392015 RepID=A0A1I7KEQ6_9BACL|nr:hypothetical protein [Alicyclobacillus macrosporangiidus]SFU95981.1 hypothetical protein SAMN05421543_11587 [Alicyclobacillus macrosporangiidus]